MRAAHRKLVGFVLCVGLAGCQRELVRTPNLYLDRDTNPFAEVPVAWQTNTVDLLYVTDRQPEGGQGNHVEYGYQRSKSMAFGSCVVQIGEDVSWDTLVEASRTRNRKVKLPLKVISVTEQGRFPDTPPPIYFKGGEALETPEYLLAERETIDALYEELRRRLAITPRKEAFVFIHGFNNTIEVAAFRLAELWHFLGREGVPILYSWPAGASGLIQGYSHDRESGEFTIYHLKEFLRALAACPDLQRVNIIAHSRGCDVIATALRELFMVASARGDDPGAVLKIGDVVLAAPDLDADVARQRYGAERLYEGWDLLTIYVTRKDKALGIAEWLLSSPTRLGKVRPEDFTATDRQRSALIQNTDIVDARIKTDYLGHGYFLSNPATSSDLILVLRYGRPPGRENGRPLTEVFPNYFILDDRYPMQAAPRP